MTVSSTPVYGHPGRTDSKGCHTCRTNCAKWGLSTGQYHCHGGSSSSSSSGSSNCDSSLAKQKAEEEARQRQQQYNQQQKENGIQAGYDYKIHHPDASISQLSGQNEYYVTGYREGFNQADNELTQTTKSKALENAKNDAVIYPTYQTQIPEGVKTDLYTQEYQSLFRTYEQDYYQSLDKLAKTNGRDIVFNHLSKISALNTITGKGKEKYQSSLENYISTFQNEAAAIKNKAKKAGYQDGLENKERKNTTFVKYADDDIYKDFLSAYQKSYQQGLHDRQSKNMKLLLSFAGAIIIIFLATLIIRYKHKK